MSYNSYEIKRGIQFILNNNPHNINALMHFYNNREISNCPAKISLEFILSNSSWTIDEKKCLLNFFQYIPEYEDITNSHFLLINNTPPIDFLILFQNTTGFIAYLLAGGHLTTKSFEMIENYITDVNQKTQMIEFIYHKYTQNKYLDVIDFSNQRIQKLPLNDCLSYVLTNDIETTTKLLPKFKDDSELLNKLLYYAILDSNKNQAELLLKTFYNNSSKKHINAIPTVLQNENFNDNFSTPLKPSANNNVFKMLSSIEPIYTGEQFMSPLQYTIASSTDIPLCETERLEKRCIIIDCLYQTQDNSTLDAQSYTRIIELFVTTGNMEKAQFYFEEARNKDISLDFYIKTTKPKIGKPKYYIKHCSNTI